MKRYIISSIALITIAVTAWAAETGPSLLRVLSAQPKVTAAPAAGVEVAIYGSHSSSSGKVFRRLKEDSVLKLGGIDTTTPDGERYDECTNIGDFPTAGLTADNAGRKCFNRTLGKFRYWNGTAIADMGGGASSLAELSDWPSAVTDTEVNYLDGVTSGIQAQLNSLTALVADLITAMEGAGIDVTPDAFSFTDQTDAALSSTITSAAITVAGLTSPAAISSSGGTYDINGSGTFTSDPGTVSNGNTVRARHTSAAAYTTATNTIVTIGGVSDTFTSTTLADPSSPAAYFGNDTVGTPVIVNGLTMYNGSVDFTCPGSGTRTIDSIDVYIAGFDGGSTCSYRVGLGTDASPSTILAQGPKETFTSANAAWRSSTSLTGTATCTGGSTYKLFVALGGDSCKVGVTTAGYGAGQYLTNADGSTDREGGFSGTEPTNGSDATAAVSIRAHVTAGL